MPHWPQEPRRWSQASPRALRDLLGGGSRPAHQHAETLPWRRALRDRWDGAGVMVDIHFAVVSPRPLRPSSPRYRCASRPWTPAGTAAAAFFISSAAAMMPLIVIFCLSSRFAVSACSRAGWWAQAASVSAKNTYGFT